MILQRLLAVGQTFISAKNSVSPYRLTQENWLPRFGSKAAAAVSEPREKSLPKSNTCQRTSVRQEPQANEAELPLAHGVKPRKTTPPRGFVVTVAESQTALPNQQAELNLDTVRVIRNDLSSSDLEIVPKAFKSRTLATTITGPAGGGGSAPRLGPLGWATRWLRSGRSIP